MHRGQEEGHHLTVALDLDDVAFIAPPELLAQVRSDDHDFFASHHVCHFGTVPEAWEESHGRGLRQSEALGEAEALELARGDDGDLVDEDDLAGDLEGREVLAAEVADGGLVEGGAVVADDGGGHVLAKDGVGQ